MKNLIITILIGLIVILLAAWRCKQAHSERPVVKIVPIKVPMSIRELQMFLNAECERLKVERYRCVIDGKPGPETFGALDKWLCDQCAIKEFEICQK